MVWWVKHITSETQWWTIPMSSALGIYEIVPLLVAGNPSNIVWELSFSILSTIPYRMELLDMYQCNKPFKNVFFTVYKHYTYIIHTLYIHYTYIIHTCMHACMHACIHPYIHTYIYIYILNSHFESTVAPPKRPNQNAIFTATSPQGTRGKNTLKVKQKPMRSGACTVFALQNIALFVGFYELLYLFGVSKSHS